MQKLLSVILLFPIFLSIIICSIIIPHIANSIEKNGIKVNLTSSNISISFDSISNEFPNNQGYYWPTPGYKIITSYFGYRKAPTGGASTYHGGIDIGAVEGSKILAIKSGTISFVGWDGGNGYAVKINHGNGIVSTYGHVNPNFVVKKGDVVKQGDYIANVGPKYVREHSYTTYRDSSGKPTNGATTGPHLHLAISINNKKVDPLSLFSI